MKRFSRKYNSRRFGIWSMVLALLGITSGCHYFEPVCMYGSPSARYSVKGTVTDENGSPLQGIGVTISGMNTGANEQEGFPMADTLRTDAAGIYTLNTQNYPWEDLKIRTFDTDGEAHGGQFAPDSATVTGYSFKKDKKDDDGWYEGEANIEVPDIKLKKK